MKMTSRILLTGHKWDAQGAPGRWSTVPGRILPGEPRGAIFAYEGVNWHVNLESPDSPWSGRVLKPGQLVREAVDSNEPGEDVIEQAVQKILQNPGEYGLTKLGDQLTQAEGDEYLKRLSSLTVVTSRATVVDKLRSLADEIEKGELNAD